MQTYEDCTSPFTPFCSSTFSPIRELQQQDKALTLIFLTSNAKYCGPVTDPWFDAQICDAKWEGEDWTTCQKAYPVSTLGCTEESTLCVGDSNRCTRLRVDGYPYLNKQMPGIPNITQELGLNPRQAAIATRIQQATYRTSFASMIQVLGGSSMLAFGNYVSCAPVLPHDQWTKEIQNWFAMFLVNLQLFNAQFVTGWQFPGINKYVTPPPDDEGWMCNAQIVRSPLYASFSVLGLVLIFLLGGVLLVLRVCTPYIVHKLQPSKSLNGHRTTSWDELSLIELASQAFETQRRESAGSSLESSLKRLDAITVRVRDLGVA